MNPDQKLCGTLGSQICSATQRTLTRHKEGQEVGPVLKLDEDMKQLKVNKACSSRSWQANTYDISLIACKVGWITWWWLV